jgi:hypothetical protein
MRHPDLPTSAQRLKAAQVSGEVQQLTFGPDRAAMTDAGELERAVTRLHAITDNPQILGHAMGTYLAYADRSDDYLPAVVMLRAAGADEKAAELKADWLRQEISEGRHLH